jgi:hypothetical protein
VLSSGVPIPGDEYGTPDMSEVARIAWVTTITIRWPPPTESKLIMVISDHTARTRTRVPTTPVSTLLHHRAFGAVSGHSGHS